VPPTVDVIHGPRCLGPRHRLLSVIPAYAEATSFVANVDKQPLSVAAAAADQELKKFLGQVIVFLVPPPTQVLYTFLSLFTHLFKQKPCAR
jgi:hypothetical protein